MEWVHENQAERFINPLPSVFVTSGRIDVLTWCEKHAMRLTFQSIFFAALENGHIALVEYVATRVAVKWDQTCTSVWKSFGVATRVTPRSTGTECQYDGFGSQTLTRNGPVSS